MCKWDDTVENLGTLKFHADYYYYATAGGAKFWVFTPSFCPAFTHHCHTVEGVPHGIANYPIRRRPLPILFLPCVTLFLIHYLCSVCTQYTSISSTNIFPPFRTLGIALAVSQRRSLVALFSQVTWCSLSNFICARTTNHLPRRKQTDWVRL
jgi:hypothetical protein